MALFDHLSDQRVKGLCETLALGSHEQQSIVAYKRSHAAAGSALGKRGLRPSQVYTILSPFDDAVILMLRARYRAAALQKYTADYLSQYKEARTATSGEDLKTLGLAPGPGYQALLRAVLHARLDGIVRTAAQELAYVKKSISGR
jgi:tRNA nucleotidyltransferase (CCA-adding enzyme)